MERATKNSVPIRKYIWNFACEFCCFDPNFVVYFGMNIINSSNRRDFKED